MALWYISLSATNISHFLVGCKEKGSSEHIYVLGWAHVLEM